MKYSSIIEAMKQSSRIKLISNNYDQHAVEYDEMSREAPPWVYFDRPFLKKNVVSIVDSKTKILEIGSGSGKVLELFKKKVPDKQIMGIDLSKELTAIAKKSLPSATFKIGDYTNISLPQNYFDVALSVRSIEYLDEVELRKTFHVVYSALKKGGRFFILTGHPIRINNGDISSYLERGPRKVSLPWGMKVDLYHKTIGDILNAATAAGFRFEIISEPDVPLLLKKKDPKQYNKYKSQGATNLHLVFSK